MGYFWVAAADAGQTGDGRLATARAEGDDPLGGFVAFVGRAGRRSRASARLSLLTTLFSSTTLLIARSRP